MEVDEYESVLATFLTVIEIPVIFHVSWSSFLSFFTHLAIACILFGSLVNYLPASYYLRCCFLLLSLQIPPAEAKQH